MLAVRIATAAVAIVLSYSAPGGAAEVRALLIGVSGYDESIGLASLRGPANDVRLWRQTLRDRGVDDIRVLADGVDGGTIPTRAAILEALADLARSGGPGDLAIVTLSGHGTRQPDASGDETDGLDEVFLPADTARAEPGAAAIPNAILDDEIGAAVDAIRATGADVWLIIDACHSGSGLRAASPDVAARFVEPSVLGIAAAAAAGPGDSAGGADTGRADLPGQVIAFYAARSSEVAREVNLDPGRPGDGAWYGLFSSRLAARLAGGEGLTYRQLFQAVLSDMNAAGLPGGARLQTPSWEGTLADAVVLGGQATAGLRQFAVTGDEIAAGLVHGMGDGTLVRLFADAADPPEAALGLAQMTDTGATRAVLRTVAEACEPRMAAPCPATGPLPGTARFARLAARPLDLVLRLAPPRDLASGAVLAPDTPLAAALERAVAAVNAAGAARVEIDPQGYAIEVAAEGGALWFGRRAAIGGTAAGLDWRPGDGADLAAILTRIAAAERLATMLGSVAGGGSLLNPSPVRIDAALVASDPADLDPPGGAPDPVRECTRALRAPDRPGPVPLPEVGDLKQCDELRFAAQGEIPGERDVNRIHIDARFCVHADYAHVEDFKRPVPLGDPMIICSDCPDGRSTGDERLFVIVTESPANAERLNLESMIETCTPTGGLPTRGAGAARVAGFLETLGRRPDTRGAFGAFAISDVWVSAWQWQVLPKEMILGSVKQVSR